MRIEEIIKLQEREFPDLPLEVIIKQDLLREGMAFPEEPQEEYKSKDYFIFTFDRVPLESMQKKEYRYAPEEIRFFGGRYHLRPTIVSVRIHPNSPYKIQKKEDKYALYVEGEYLADVEFFPIPSYYKEKYSFPRPVGEVAPVIEWGYLIYLTVFRNCQYFGEKEECRFCDINHNWRQQKQVGRPYTGVKPVEWILEALEKIDSTYPPAKALTITGGAIIKALRGKTEAEFYKEYAYRIHKRFGDRWISKMVIQALTPDECRMLKDAGVKIYHPNYEVWGEELFQRICPGKAQYIGWKEWVRRILEAAKIFGEKYVIPNFVAGVEMTSLGGFTKEEEAVKHTLEGVEFFFSHGIIPRFTTWCPEPFTYLGQESPPPLRYFLLLLRGYRDLHKKYKLWIPPGYGPAGVGKAVFSVSPFMDVLEEEVSSI